MDDMLKKYLTEKYGENYESDAQSKYDDQTSKLNVAGLFSNLGDAIAGNKIGSNNAYFDGLRKEAKNSTLGKIDADKKSFMAESAFSNQQKEAELKQAKLDPNSEISKNFRAAFASRAPLIAKSYGDRFDQLTASEEDMAFKWEQLAAQNEAKKETARIYASTKADAREQRNHEREMKLDEKNEALKTPYGLARTTDDAKQVKEAGEVKKSFDQKLEEMIALREKSGGEMWNREDVKRGKQLSQDLLLDYKTLSKLGVLSASDMNILNQIIPDDPLEFSPIESLKGEDSILANMKKFKQDKQSDFQNRLDNRIRPGTEIAQPQQSHSSEQATVKVIAPNGKVKIIPVEKLQAAIASGAKPVGAVAGK